MGRLRGLLGRLGWCLGASWEPVGVEGWIFRFVVSVWSSPGACHGSLLGRLGQLLNRLGARLGHLGRLLGRPGTFLGRLGNVVRASWAVLERSGEFLGRS